MATPRSALRRGRLAVPIRPVVNDGVVSPQSVGADDKGDLSGPARVQLIRTALSMKQAGGVGGHYDQLVIQLRTAKDPTALANLYTALTHNVAHLGAAPSKFSTLLDAAFMFSWAIASEELVATFVNFLCHIVSANSCFLVPSFRVLVRNLCPPEASTEADFKHLEARAGPIHETIRSILRLVPTGAPSLFTVLQDSFPHRRLDLPVQRAYVTHVLRIADEVPSLRDRLVMLIVSRIIQIDVEIKLEDVPDASAVDDALDNDVERMLFPMEDAEAGVAGVDGSAGGIASTDEMAKKLDVLMEVLFAYIKRHMVAAMTAPSARANPEVPPPAAASTFRMLLRVFERQILTTHKSKYTQFLVFYAAHFHAAFPDAFVGRLIDTMRSEKCPRVTRQSCAAYLGSFLARAQYVDSTTLRSAFCFVMEWIHSYIANVEAGHHTGTHEVFYSICQSAFYVVCFHHKTLQDTADGLSFLSQFKWDIVVESRLAPVRHCAEAIAREFLRVCRHLRLADRRMLATLRVSHARPAGGAARAAAAAAAKAASAGAVAVSAGSGAGSGAGAGAGGSGTPSEAADGSQPPVASPGGVRRVDETARAGGLGTGSNPLDSFFPFDPYLLRNSSVYINDLYRGWRGLDVGSDDEDGASTDTDGAHSDGGSTAGSYDSRAGGRLRMPSDAHDGPELGTPGGGRRARGFSFDVHPGAPDASSRRFGDDGLSYTSSVLGTPVGDDDHGSIAGGWSHAVFGDHAAGHGARRRSVSSDIDDDELEGPAMMIRGRPVQAGVPDNAGMHRRGGGAGDSGSEAESLPNMSLGTTPIAPDNPLSGFVRRKRQGSMDSSTFVDGWGDDDF